MQRKRAILGTGFTAVLIATAWVRLGAPVAAAQVYAVSDFGNNIWRVEDVNSDGDALDTGERILWAQGAGCCLTGMAFDGASLYALDSGLPAGGAQLVRLIDNNLDGDALDVGENTLWLDGLESVGNDLARDPSGDFFFTDYVRDVIWRLADLNGDQDVLDIAEKTVFADGIELPLAILPHNDSLLVARRPSVFEAGVIDRLTDLNGDGDALDVGEVRPITPSIGDIVGGLLDDSAGGFYYSSFNGDALFHAVDINNDGDMLDVGEVLLYADALPDGFDEPHGMAAFDGGGLLLADSNRNQVQLVRDLNGDGDALDIGEVVLFVDGIIYPTDIVPMAFGLPGDYNGDGTVNAADYTVYRNRKAGIGGTTLINEGVTPGEVTVHDYEFWKLHYGETAGSGAGQFHQPANLPEPAISGLMFMATLSLIAARRRR